MLIGITKWFDSEKGFGIVETPNEGEFFLHKNSFLNQAQSVVTGTAVVFSKKIDSIKNRNAAENSRIVGDAEDWKLIFEYLGKNAIVNLEIETKSRGRNGISYYHKVKQPFSLLDLSLKQYFRYRSENEIANTAIEYFNDSLNDNHFVAYCDVVENGILKTIPPEISTSLLKTIFTHFGKNINEEILFQVWKNKRFRFIAFEGAEEYEIPEKVLTLFDTEIGIPELRRIKNFSFGSNFCSRYVDMKLNLSSSSTKDQINDAYTLIQFEKDEKKEERRKQLDDLYLRMVTKEIVDKATKLGSIKNSDDLSEYTRLIQLVPKQFKDEEKTQIQAELNNIIALKSAEEFKPELWLKGIIDNVSFELISISFLDKINSTGKNINILSKLPVYEQMELLKRFATANDPGKAFQLLESLIRQIQSLDHYFRLSEVLFDADFWKEKPTAELVVLFSAFVTNECTDDQKYELFFKGFVKEIPKNEVRKNIHKIHRDSCAKIFKSLATDKLFIKEILERKSLEESPNNLDWLYDLGDEFLNSDNFKEFDTNVFNSIEQIRYFELWKKGKAKLFPDSYIKTFLQDKYESYEQIKSWTRSAIVTPEDMNAFLLFYLNEQLPVTDRVVFYKQYNHIKYLVQEFDFPSEKIASIGNSFYNLVLWVIDKTTTFDFNQLKRKFIYFVPEEQTRIIRKLFFLKANRQLELTPELLNELTRFDLDSYSTSQQFNPELTIDISTDVVIKALLSYSQSRRFFVENELLDVILHDLRLDKTKRFKLANYFEDCQGRLLPKYNWETKGEVSKVIYGDNKFYFAIKFDYNSRLVDEVRKIPGRKWNDQTKVWGVPAQGERQVLEFAKANQFFLNFEGSNYTNNTHLVEFKREDKPNGINFCEGRLANRLHEQHNKLFWWCAGKPCFGKCETIHSQQEWEQYTLLDFCEILGLNTDEINKMGDIIPKGFYYQFISLINRFNVLLERLYCRDCNHILYPASTGHFAAQTVVRFHCVNEKCSNHDIIYLTHCLNGQCGNIIDSRVSKKCPNGLFICNDCGSCCSHEMFKRRLSNLELTGGHIHEELRKCIEQKLGHLERAEYYCYKCTKGMDEISEDIFQCKSCKAKYDTTKFKFKRIHKYLKQVNQANSNNRDDTLDCLF